MYGHPFYDNGIDGYVKTRVIINGNDKCNLRLTVFATKTKKNPIFVLNLKRGL